MEQIKHRGCIYNLHPIFYRYAASENGRVVDIKGNLIEIKRGDDGYYFVNLEYGPQIHKYPIHQFVWECFNGIKPKNGVIEHINGNKKR